MRTITRVVLAVLMSVFVLTSAEAWAKHAKKPDYRYKTPNLKYKKPKIKQHSSHKAPKHHTR